MICLAVEEKTDSPPHRSALDLLRVFNFTHTEQTEGSITIAGRKVCHSFQSEQNQDYMNNLSTGLHPDEKFDGKRSL